MFICVAVKILKRYRGFVYINNAGEIIAAAVVCVAQVTLYKLEKAVNKKLMLQ
jgi:hypothetical protein